MLVFLRDLLEARLLTGQDMDEVAQQLGVHSHTVVIYEALFFSVRDRLGSADYIYKAALRPPLALKNKTRTDPAERRRYVYRAIAYCGGVAALDAVLAGNLGKPTNAEELEKWHAESLRHNLNIQALEAMWDPEIALHDLKKLIMQAIRLEPQAAKAREAAEAQEKKSVDVDKIIAEVKRSMRGCPPRDDPTGGRWYADCDDHFKDTPAQA